MVPRIWPADTSDRAGGQFDRNCAWREDETLLKGYDGIVRQSRTESGVAWLPSRFAGFWSNVPPLE
jgi:hypothetical protein